MHSRAALLGPILLAVSLGLVPTIDSHATEPGATPAASTLMASTTMTPPDADATSESSTTIPSVAKPATATPGAAPVPQSPPVVVARVDLSSQRMTVTVDGTLAHTWRISSGALGARTPTGTFGPQILSKHHRSSLYYGAPMPYAVFFNAHIATHGTNAVRHLGRPASHGCVRLDTANARTFFELVQKYGKPHVRIVVEGTTPTNGIALAPSRPRAPKASDLASSGSVGGWARQAFAAD